MGPDTVTFKVAKTEHCRRNKAILQLQHMEEVISNISSILRTVFPSYEGKVSVERPANPKFGDYTCINAMEIFRSLPRETYKSPQHVAETIARLLRESYLFRDVITTPQGHINVFLTVEYLLSTLRKITVLPPSVDRKRVVIDFSSPNIAKELHVGHLRSTILGESLARTLEYCGHEVHRINHVGDWGTPFGMIISYLKEMNKLDENSSDHLDLDWVETQDMQSLYRAAKLRFDTDTEFKARARNEVVLLQNGDHQNREIWRRLCEVSERQFQALYDRLDVTLQTVGESFYQPFLSSLVVELEEKGLITIDEGVKLMFIPGYEQPLIVQKSDQGYTYDTTDLAALRYRIMTMGAEWIIYVVDAGQSSHFELLFAAGALAGWYKPGEIRLDHVSFGVICGADGKRLKTRSGTTVKLVDLLNEAVSEAAKALRNRPGRHSSRSSSEPSDPGMTQEEVESISAAVGHSAVKYYDLKRSRISSYNFSYDQMLDLKGNTAVYLLYNYSRIVSILAQPEVSEDDHSREDPVDLEMNEELQLARYLVHFPEAVAAILDPHWMGLHLLASFMYELCGLFSQFHKRCRVIGHARQSTRLFLCRMTKDVLEQGFHLLGIRPINKM